MFHVLPGEDSFVPCFVLVFLPELFQGCQQTRKLASATTA